MSLEKPKWATFQAVFGLSKAAGSVGLGCKERQKQRSGRGADAVSGAEEAERGHLSAGAPDKLVRPI